MLKRRDAPYGVGRPRGPWWKWKVEPFTVDAVMIYAQAGHGRRASLHTDYTFAVWDGDQLVPFAKAYSGLTDAEIRQLDAWIRRNTRERFGPVRSVPPEQVFELAFEGIQASPRHKCGIAVRFPRIVRWRTDKPPVGGGHPRHAARPVGGAPVSRVAPPRSPDARAAAPSIDDRVAIAREWMRARGWTPFRFQQEVWRAYLHGESGLVHAATGTGKTLAAWLGPLVEAVAPPRPAPTSESGGVGASGTAHIADAVHASPRRHRSPCSGSRRCARSPPTPPPRSACRWPTSRRRGRWRRAPATPMQRRARASGGAFPPRS